MLPDRVSNPGPLTYESGALPIALRGLAHYSEYHEMTKKVTTKYHIRLISNYVGVIYMLPS